MYPCAIMQQLTTYQNKAVPEFFPLLNSTLSSAFRFYWRSGMCLEEPPPEVHESLSLEWGKTGAADAASANDSCQGTGTFSMAYSMMLAQSAQIYKAQRLGNN